MRRRKLPAVLALAAVGLLGTGRGCVPPDDSNVIHACEGLFGFLRQVADPSECRRPERALAWQRRGGVRVSDATGQDLGRLAGRQIYNDAADVTFRPGLDGGIDDQPLVVLRYQLPGCQGAPYVELRPMSEGQLLKDPRGPEGALIVATDRRTPRESFTEASNFTRASGCRDGSASIRLGVLAEVETFIGDLGFAFPVTLPLRVSADPTPEPGEDGSIQVCVGGFGLMRRVAPGQRCRPWEREEAWLVRGGLHVFDGADREIGLSMFGDFASQSIYVPPADLWFELPDLATAPPRFGVSYDGPDCTGEAYVQNDSFVNRLFGNPRDGPEWLVTTGPRLTDVAVVSEAHPTLGCIARERVIRRAQAFVPFEGDLGFEFPLVLPLVPGLPGSPVADPEGRAPGTGVQHACRGLLGVLRAVEDPAHCYGPSLSWERRGGVRLLDGEGRDVGALFGFFPGTAHNFVEVATGLRFAVDPQSGELGLGIGGRDRLWFESDVCSGRGFHPEEDTVGVVTVSADVATPTGLYVGTGIVEDVAADSTWLGTECSIQFNPRPRLFPIATGFEPFLGQLPRDFPVVVPMRVGGALR